MRPKIIILLITLLLITTGCASTPEIRDNPQSTTITIVASDNVSAQLIQKNIENGILKAEVEQLQKQINDLINSTAGSVNQVEYYKNRVKGLEGELSNLQAAHLALIYGKGELQTQANALAAHLSTSRAEYNTLSDKYGFLRSEIDAITDRTDKITSANMTDQKYIDFYQIWDQRVLIGW